MRRIRGVTGKLGDELAVITQRCQIERRPSDRSVSGLAAGILFYECEDLL